MAFSDFISTQTKTLIFAGLGQNIIKMPLSVPGQSME